MTKEQQTKSMLHLESETPAPPATAPESELSPNDITDASNDSSRVSKMALRKLMVLCIDSALEELGPLVRQTASEGLHASVDKSNAPGSLSGDAANSVVATNTATLEDESNPYGYGSSSPEPTKVCPELQLSGRIRRPRYQRRGSVTKFSLSNAFNQVQAEESKGYLKDHSAPGTGDATSTAAASVGSAMVRSPSQQLLWPSLYCNVDDRPIKRTSLSSFVGGIHPMVADLNCPSAKRRRGMF